jgi:hypothetical protein
MSNVELIAYEQELSDNIVQASVSDSGGTSVGLGFGSWGSSSGFGIGVSQSLRSGNPSRELSARRDAVRIEMRSRGLLPP